MYGPKLGCSTLRGNKKLNASGKDILSVSHQNAEEQDAGSAEPVEVEPEANDMPFERERDGDMNAEGAEERVTDGGTRGRLSLGGGVSAMSESDGVSGSDESHSAVQTTTIEYRRSVSVMSEVAPSATTYA